MNSLAYRIGALVTVRRPRGPLISSRALERRQVLPGRRSRGSGFVLLGTHQHLERLGSVKPREIGSGSSTCRPIMIARIKRTTVPRRRAALVGTLHVVACEVAS